MNDLLKKNIDFYNNVANEYDNQQLDRKSEIVRSFVKNYVLQTVKPCRLLDFGGGTGMDLAWLIENNFSVTFCEPAEKMRDIAIRRAGKIAGDRIYFLGGDKNKFETWTNENLPFPQAGCVLANFNVINSIPDMKLLFQKLKIVLVPGGHFIGTMLNMRFVYRMKIKPVHVLNSLFHKQTSKQENPVQSVFRHKPGYLRMIAKPAFSLHSMNSIPGTDFLLFDFTCIA
jgi:SAM-dependent methyltransferase